MDWGLKNRIARIIAPADNRALMLAVDHGYFLGPTEKLEDLKKTIAPLAKHCDSLMITRGALRTSVNPNYPVPIVLRVSGGTSIIGEDLSQEDITVSVKDAIRLNATALAMSVFVGSKYEYQTIVNLGKLVNEAEEYGIPVLAVTAVGKEIGTKDARYLSLACRVAAEQGAHIVKTYYCENFEKVVKSCPVPIIIAGGKKIPEKDALKLTYDALKAGAVGVDMGRNIWQSDNPIAMIKAVHSIVHGSNNAEQAFTMYKQLSGKPNNNKPTQKPNNNKPTQKPNNNKPTQKPNNNKPTQKPNNNKPTQKPNNNKPTQKPNNNKPTQKPNNNKPTQKPNNNKPTQKPNNNKPTQKPNNNKPTQKPNNNKPTQKPNNNKPNDNFKN